MAVPAPEALWQDEGFQPWPMAGRFVPPMGAVWFRPDGANLLFRIAVTPQHCNGFDLAHGGFVSTMADIWLGYNLARRLPPDARFVTTSLTVDFLKPVRPGHCLEGRIAHVHTGRRLHHASGVMLAGGATVAAMRAAFSSI